MARHQRPPGPQLRSDKIPRVGLFETVAREGTQVVRQDRVNETAYGAFAEARTVLSPWTRSVIALRFDSIQSNVTTLGGAFNFGDAGAVRGAQGSPKVSLAFGPFSRTELFVNAGRGFHSNDMRGVTARTNPVDGTVVQPCRCS
jgi:outer membrane receptor protein involved in Fe transport